MITITHITCIHIIESILPCQKICYFDMFWPWHMCFQCFQCQLFAVWDESCHVTVLARTRRTLSGCMTLLLAVPAATWQHRIFPTAPWQVASEVMVAPLKVPWPFRWFQRVSDGFRDLRLVKLFALFQLKNHQESRSLSCFCAFVWLSVEDFHACGQHWSSHAARTTCIAMTIWGGWMHELYWVVPSQGIYCFVSQQFGGSKPPQSAGGSSSSLRPELLLRRWQMVLCHRCYCGFSHLVRWWDMKVPRSRCPVQLQATDREPISPDSTCKNDWEKEKK